MNERMDASNAIRRRFGFGALWVLVVLAGCGDQEPEIPPQQLPGSPFHYPEDLWDAGVEGETVLELHVSEVGQVDSARVERTSGYPAFDSAAVRGARDLRFEPARRGDDSVAVKVLLPVQFYLPASEGDGVAGELQGSPEPSPAGEP
jgi:periplasmic protein TonB